MMKQLAYLVVAAAVAVGHEQFDNPCEIHGVQMAEVEVPVTYGYLARRGHPSTAKKMLFPHGKTSLNAGCSVTSRKTTFVTQCSDCVVAKAAFEQGFDAGWGAAKNKFAPEVGQPSADQK